MCYIRSASYVTHVTSRVLHAMMSRVLVDIQVLRNVEGGGGVCVKFSRKKRYEGVRFNVI